MTTLTRKLKHKTETETLTDQKVNFSITHNRKLAPVKTKSQHLNIIRNRIITPFSKLKRNV